MSTLPDGWVEACKESEAILKNYTPIEAISAKFCIESACPAALVGEFYTPQGKSIYIRCMFSKCVKRYPKSLKLMR